jgi:hypothetical protein
MKPPKKFRLVGQDFTVRVRPLRKMLGRTIVDKQQITLGVAQGEGSMRECLLHEILHVAICKAGMPRDILNEGKDEAMVKRLAPLLMELLCENPAVYAYISGRKVK